MGREVGAARVARLGARWLGVPREAGVVARYGGGVVRSRAAVGGGQRATGGEVARCAAEGGGGLRGARAERHRWRGWTARREGRAPRMARLGCPPRAGGWPARHRWQGCRCAAGVRGGLACRRRRGRAARRERRLGGGAPLVAGWLGNTPRNPSPRKAAMSRQHGEKPVLRRLRGRAASLARQQGPANPARDRGLPAQPHRTTPHPHTAHPGRGPGGAETLRRTCG